MDPPDPRRLIGDELSVKRGSREVFADDRHRAAISFEEVVSPSFGVCGILECKHSIGNEAERDVSLNTSTPSEWRVG